MENWRGGIQIQSRALQDVNHDPAWDAIQARANYMEETFKKVYNGFLFNLSNSEKCKHGDASELMNRAAISEEICNIAYNQIPDLWKLGQSYFTGELRETVIPNPGDFKKIILSCIKTMCVCLRNMIFYGFDNLGSGIFFPIVWPSNISASTLSKLINHLSQSLKFLRNAYVRLIRLDLPGEALDIVQKSIDEVRIFCLSAFLVRSVEKIKRLGSMELWKCQIDEFPGVTVIPSMFENIIIETLEESRICSTQEIRESDITDSEDGYIEITERLKDIFMTFCNIVENLAFSLNDEEMQTLFISQLIDFPNVQDDYLSFHSGMSRSQHMLCCMSNSLYCQQWFFARIEFLFVRYGYTSYKDAVNIGKTHMKQLFVNLLDAFVEHKTDPLVGTIEPSMYIGNFQWDLVQHSNGLRPYVRECIDNLISVFSEIITVSPNLLSLILEPIIQTVAEELARLMSCVPHFNRKGAIQAYADVHFIVDLLKVFTNTKAREYFIESFEAIGPLTEEEQSIAKDTLKIIFGRIKLQSLCLSVNHS